MRRNLKSKSVEYLRLVFRLCIITALSPFSVGQEWPFYGGGPGGSKYSRLDQIDRSNVSKLKVAWIYHTRDMSDGSDNPVHSAFEATPLVADGVMYFTTPFGRVVALEAETGRELWTFDPKLDRQRPYNLFISRGLALWRRGEERRIYSGTLDGRLFAVDARKGRPVTRFGEGGFVDLRRGVAEKYPNRAYGVTSPPVVFENLVIVGSMVSDAEPLGPSGDVRAFDVDTGKLVWTFHTVPRPGEAGHETWDGESWRERGGTNVWAPMSLDEQRGLLFLPVTSPSPDRYGGERKGQNLFGDSLVALDAGTGKVRWYYQIIHHDIWDYDLPAQPLLVDIQRGGKLVPVVVQITKMGLTFIFERETGKPVFEIEERKVPPSRVPGEEAWPTQPFPVKPPPLIRHTMTADEITNVTPESRRECMEIMKDARIGAFYEPPGLEYTIIFPGTNGGPNWGGGSFDPSSNLLFVNSMDVGEVMKLVKPAAAGSVPYRPRTLPNFRFWDSKRLPCQKPPWGKLSAVDLASGEIRWQVTLGVVDELIRLGLPPTGAPNLGGSIVTAGGLVFIASTNDSRFRAFDKDNGRELWVTRLPASGHATPMTFKGVKTGKQFVVIAAGGGNKYNDSFSDALIAFALP